MHLVEGEVEDLHSRAISKLILVVIMHIDSLDRGDGALLGDPILHATHVRG